MKNHIFLDKFYCLEEQLTTNMTKSLRDTIASYYGYGWRWLIGLTLTYAHAPNLEMLSHLKMAIWLAYTFCLILRIFYLW